MRAIWGSLIQAGKHMGRMTSAASQLPPVVLSPNYADLTIEGHRLVLFA